MITAEKVSKNFDGAAALSNVSCTIPNGSVYGMVGSNGAGKSTFLRILCGVYKADGGTVSADGEGVYENPKVKSQIAFVPDELFFPAGASLEAMEKNYANIFCDFDKERYQELTKEFELPFKRPIGTFSKGMKRQAAITLALARKPKYLLFDETFDGLDPIVRNYAKSIIMNDVAERNALAVITSHSLRELEDTCDQLMLLHKGGIVLESEVTNLKTSLFKIQIAFNFPYDESLFENIDIVKFSKSGAVSNIIVRGDREEVTRRLVILSPVLLDILPLTLEEVFTYEMEALGYDFISQKEEMSHE